MRSCPLTVAPSVFVLAVITGCQLEPGPRPFRPVGAVSRVVVVRGSHDTLTTIDDTARIRALVAFVDARRDGWKVPWAGVPVAPVEAAFLRSATDKGAVHYFGAGRAFFEASSQPGDFASRAASPAEVNEFLRLVGVPASALDQR